MDFSKKYFGTLPDCRDISLFTISAGDLSLSVSTLGATLTSLNVPSKNKGIDDIVLGYDDFNSYVTNRWYFGATVGRYANRINDARFRLNDREYCLSRNKPNCSLHGGTDGFSKRVWEGAVYSEGDCIFARFTLCSHDNDQGYPGNLNAAVSYGLSHDNRFIIRFEASVDAPCPINLTNHSYFNLSGHKNNASVCETEARLYCSNYIEVSDCFIPTGRILSVSGTVLDFTTAKLIGRDIEFMPHAIGGYDHCMVVDGKPGQLRPAGDFFDSVSGRKMKCLTTCPGVQFYTGNMLNMISGKKEVVYHKHSGFCFEPQYYPDSPNQPDFPSAIFFPYRPYSECMEISFDW